MQIANITYLFLLWIIPALVIFYVRSFRIKDRFIDNFVSNELRSNLISNDIRPRQKFKAFLLILAVILLIIAFIQPRFGFKWEDVTRQGIDIIIAIDVSGSMLAEDVKPNRLERAKREISDLLQMLQGDRVGLVAFAGTSFVQCPLTLDYSSVKMFLDYINTELIPVQGTAIGHAIRTSIKSFSKSGKSKSKALILITDGEDHEEDPLEEAEKAAKEDIKIFAIGIGKEGGAPIPDKKEGGFKKDENGDMVLTKLDEVTLQKLALQTGGSYVRSVTGDLDLEQIYLNDIRKNMKKEELEGTKRKRWKEHFQWFIFGAVMLVCLEFLISENDKRAKGKRSQKHEN